MDMRLIAAIEDLLLGNFDPYWFWSMGVVLLTLAVIGIAPVVLETGVGSHGTLMVYARRIFLSFFAALVTLLIGGAIMLPSRLGRSLAGDLAAEWAWDWGPFLIAAIILGLGIRLLWQRYADPWISQQLRALRTEQETEMLSDIRTEIDIYQALDYHPPDFYKPDQVFTGLTPNREPIYFAMADWYETNKTVVGATRFGKGVTAQIWADQAIRRGDMLIYVDPKKDKFMPHVLRQICDETGRRFIALDLVDQSSRGTWAPFVGGTPQDRRSRFYDIMDMGDRGTDADHYKAGARKRIFPLFDGSSSTSIAALLHAVDTLSAKDEAAEKALSTVSSRLTEWASYPKFSPPSGKGFSIEQSLLSNAVVYVRGSLDDLVVNAATRAFIMEVVQEVRRLELQRTTHVTLMVDEVRFTLSETLLRALATVLGVNCDVVTMYQNFGDLKAPIDERIDGESALQSVRVNSQIKLLFGGTDPETAEWVAEASGTRLKKITQMEQTDVNRSGGEVFSPLRRLKHEEEAWISMNTVLALPPRVAVLFRPRALAEIVCVDKIPLKPASAAVGPPTGQAVSSPAAPGGPSASQAAPPQSVARPPAISHQGLHPAVPPPASNQPPRPKRRSPAKPKPAAPAPAPAGASGRS
jgi:hypothetical protein